MSERVKDQGSAVKGQVPAPLLWSMWYTSSGGFEAWSKSVEGCVCVTEGVSERASE